jgi:hypothetical protein
VANQIVSTKKYKHKKMFGTDIRLTVEKETLKDPCSGDSGGPLIYKTFEKRFVLIGRFNKSICNMNCHLCFNVHVDVGTIQGSGYDCRTDTFGVFEGSMNGLWNKVGGWEIYLFVCQIGF